MSKEEKVDLIVKYYNEHFKWQRLVNGQEIDRSKVEAMTDKELDEFIERNCK